MTRATGFWTRRRAAVSDEEAREEALIAQRLVEEQALAEAAAQEEKTDEEILSELDLPDPDTLVSGDDFAAFMGRAVPDRLRRRALRRLWRSDPKLACLDNLVDYNDDYTHAATAGQIVKTAYQVGSGMRYHIERTREIAEALAAKTDTAIGLEDTGLEDLNSRNPETAETLVAPADGATPADLAPLARDERARNVRPPDPADAARLAGLDAARDMASDEENLASDASDGAIMSHEASPATGYALQDDAAPAPRRRMRFAFEGDGR